MILPTDEARYGDELDADIQGIVRDLSGLSGRYVRPRWQPTAPWTPAIDETWMAVAVTSIEADEGVVVESESLTYHERIEAMITAYGPDSSRVLNLMIVGAKVPDNVAMIQALGLYYQGTLQVVPAPELVNDQWLKRYDTTMVFRRKIERRYGINYIASAEAIIYNDQGLDPQTIEVSDE